MLKKSFLVSIFSVVFIDLLGVGIVIPVLAPMLLNQDSPFMPLDATFADRTVMLGLLTAVFAIAIFFGAPIIGALADRFGRKKMLIFSLIGTLVGYVLFSIGIITGQLWLLFLGRGLDGFTGGNISVVQAMIADSTTPEERSSAFGIIGMAFGFGFIIGPALGGVLSNPNIVSWFNYSTPFIFAALISLFNLIIVSRYIKETLVEKVNKKISLLTGVKNLAKAFSMKEIRLLFIVAFLVGFGFTFYTQFFQVLLIERYQFSASQIAVYFSFIGLCVAIVQGGVTRPLSKKFTPIQIIKWSLIILAVALLFQAFPNPVVFVYLIVPFVAIGNGLSQPNLVSLVSQSAGPESQGEILGINQSIQAVGFAIPPLLAGYTAGLNPALPVFIGSFSIFVAWLIFLKWRQPKKEEVFHEV